MGHRITCANCGGPTWSNAEQCLVCENADRQFYDWKTGALREIIRPIDDMVAAKNPMNRPAHYPPPCLVCNGFGYLPGSWSACPTCRQHPGHSCSHADWLALRA